MLKQLPPNSAKVNTVRVLADSDFVFTPTEYKFFGPTIGFDIFRFEDGKIVRAQGQPPGNAEGPQSKRAHDDRRDRRGDGS